MQFVQLQIRRATYCTYGTAPLIELDGVIHDFYSSFPTHCLSLSNCGPRWYRDANWEPTVVRLIIRHDTRLATPRFISVEHSQKLQGPIWLDVLFLRLQDAGEGSGLVRKTELEALTCHEKACAATMYNHFSTTSRTAKDLERCQRISANNIDVIEDLPNSALQ